MFLLVRIYETEIQYELYFVIFFKSKLILGKKNRSFAVDLNMLFSFKKKAVLNMFWPVCLYFVIEAQASEKVIEK